MAVGISVLLRLPGLLFPIIRILPMDGIRLMFTTTRMIPMTLPPTILRRNATQQSPVNRQDDPAPPYGRVDSSMRASTYVQPTRSREPPVGNESQYRSERPAVQNVIRALQCMPDARQRQIESGRYGQLTRKEWKVVRVAANLPPA